MDPAAPLPPQPAEIVAPANPQEQPQQPQDGIPEEVLQIPAMQALMAGAPPAVSAKISDYNNRPEGKLIAEAKEPLMKSGIGFYKSLSGEYGVLFNSLRINPQDIQAADKAGQLLEIAPLMDTVDAETAKSGQNNPVLAAEAPSGAPMARSASVPPSGPGMIAPPVSAPPAPASAQRALLNARVKNMQPGAPTSGPKPGQGRIANQILKPVV
jgi:hypothetical protein